MAMACNGISEAIPICSSFPRLRGFTFCTWRPSSTSFLKALAEKC